MRPPEERRAAIPSRDQGESAFTSILRALVARVPGARAAALVDFQGETVDYAGRTIPFDLRVAAAHWRIVLDEAEARLPGARWLAVRFARRSYLVYGLPERYALVVVLARAAGLAGWHRAVVACVRALGDEAKWTRGASPIAPWFCVDVVSDSQRRPKSVRVAGHLLPVEILGTVVHERSATADLAHGERGWRVRFDTGAEATLVREPGGRWYADAEIEGTVPGRRQSTDRKSR